MVLYKQGREETLHEGANEPAKLLETSCKDRFTGVENDAKDSRKEQETKCVLCRDR
jgi:hypothetical protein